MAEEHEFKDLKGKMPSEVRKTDDKIDGIRQFLSQLEHDQKEYPNGRVYLFVRSPGGEIFLIKSLTVLSGSTIANDRTETPYSYGVIQVEDEPVPECKATRHIREHTDMEPKPDVAN